MTIDPAYASFTEATLGSLEIGKRADFTILSQDIMQIPPEDILRTQVHATIIDGRPVYGSIWFVLSASDVSFINVIFSFYSTVALRGVPTFAWRMR